MRTICTLIFVLAFGVLAGFGQDLKTPDEATNAAYDKEQIVAELKSAKKLFDKALETKDRDHLERHFADEYIYRGATSVGNKEQVIGYMVSPAFKHVAGGQAEDKEYLILSGDSAIETGRLTGGADPGNARQTQMITVWVRRDGRWQVIADYFYPAAANPTAAGNESPDSRDAAFDTRLLQEMTRVYEVSMSGRPLGEYIYSMKRDQLGGREVFRVTRTFERGDTKTVQTSVFDAQTFEPISSSSKGDAVFDLEYSEGQIRGEIQMPDGKLKEMNSGTYKQTLLPWMYEAALTMLPLKIGYESILPVVNPKTARVEFMGARVLGEKTIEVPAGKFDVYEVELTGFETETVFLRREAPHIPIRQDWPPALAISLKSIAGPGK